MKYLTTLSFFLVHTGLKFTRKNQVIPDFGQIEKSNLPPNQYEFHIGTASQLLFNFSLPASTFEDYQNVNSNLFTFIESNALQTNTRFQDIFLGANQKVSHIGVFTIAEANGLAKPSKYARRSMPIKEIVFKVPAGLTKKTASISLLPNSLNQIIYGKHSLC